MSRKWTTFSTHVLQWSSYVFIQRTSTYFNMRLFACMASRSDHSWRVFIFGFVQSGSLVALTVCDLRKKNRGRLIAYSALCRLFCRPRMVYASTELHTHFFRTLQIVCCKPLLLMERVLTIFSSSHRESKMHIHPWYGSYWERLRTFSVSARLDAHCWFRISSER